MASRDDSHTRVVFPTLEQRPWLGLIGQLRPTQVLVAGGGVLVAILLLFVAANLAGLAAGTIAITLGGATAFWPAFNGLTLEQLLPRMLRSGLRSLLGEHNWRSPAPTAGVTARGERPPLPSPPELRTIRLVGVQQHGEEIGVIIDHARRTYTAVMAVHAQSAALLDEAERTRLCQTWGRTLANLGRQNSPVSRVQLIHHVVPGDASEALARVVEQHDPKIPWDDPVLASYVELLEQAAPATQTIELYLALQIDARRAARLLRRHGGHPHARAAVVLLREVKAFAAALRNAGVVPDRILDRHQLIDTVRALFDPSTRPRIARRNTIWRDRRAVPVHPSDAWPAGWQQGDEVLHVDGSFHRTYWVRRWPQVPVGLDVFMPLLIGAQCQYTFSVTFAPIPPVRARQEAELDVQVDDAQQARRDQQQRSTTAKHQRQHEAAVRRDQELSAGHADYLFAGYLTVSASTRDALDDACDEILQATSRCWLDIEPLDWEQALGRTYTLPLCRGVEGR